MKSTLGSALQNFTGKVGYWLWVIGDRSWVQVMGNQVTEGRDQGPEFKLIMV